MKAIEKAMRQRIIHEARSWLGTRFKHQGRIKRREHFAGGVDCAGLIIEVGNALALFREPMTFHHYTRMPAGDYVRQACDAYLTPIPLLRKQPGDILLLQIHTEPQHLALLSDRQILIHSYAPAKHVEELRFDETWQQRLVGVYSYPKLASAV